ncbi:MAG: hypothetical protein O7F73_17250 [Gammaproteobacteria bacterium]|nr:hypothetical protein [Gammaproteobacteria bacterium]
MSENWFFLEANGTEVGTTLYVAVKRQSDEVNFSVENEYSGDTLSGTGALASISLTRQEAQRLVDELGKELTRATG